MNRLLYIGGGREAEETLGKARDLGLSVVYVQRKKEFKEALLAYVDQVVLIDYGDPTVLLPIARALHQVFPFSRALSLSEDALVPAAQVRAAVGLPGNSVETVRLLKDKALMRERLNALGISPVAASVGSRPDDVCAFVAQHGLPVIVKPVDASGSLGILRIDCTDQIPEVCREVSASVVREPDPGE